MPSDPYIYSLQDEVAALRARVAELERERDAARATNTRLHRRLQQVESSLRDSFTIPKNTPDRYSRIDHVRANWIMYRWAEKYNKKPEKWWVSEENVRAVIALSEAAEARAERLAAALREISHMPSIAAAEVAVAALAEPESPEEALHHAIIAAAGDWPTDQKPPVRMPGFRVGEPEPPAEPDERSDEDEPEKGAPEPPADEPFPSHEEVMAMTAEEARVCRDKWMRKLGVIGGIGRCPHANEPEPPAEPCGSMYLCLRCGASVPENAPCPTCGGDDA